MHRNKKSTSPSKPRHHSGRRKNKHQYNSVNSDGLDKSQHKILEKVKNDRVIQTGPEEDRRRRTIIVERKKGNFGFTIQTYGIHHKHEGEIELITYIDYVEYDGPAYRAGMRPGDVILSINGQDMERVEHQTLVKFIKNCDKTMRIVVLFEDCVHKVELHMKSLHLKRVLQQKKFELQELIAKEQEIIQSLKARGIKLPPSPLGRGPISPAQSSTMPLDCLDPSSWNRSSFLTSSTYATLPKTRRPRAPSAHSTPRGSWDCLDTRTSPTPSQSTDTQLDEEEEEDQVTRL